MYISLLEEQQIENEVESDERTYFKFVLIFLLSSSLLYMKIKLLNNHLKVKTFVSICDIFSAT